MRHKKRVFNRISKRYKKHKSGEKLIDDDTNEKLLTGDYLPYFLAQCCDDAYNKANVISEKYKGNSPWIFVDSNFIQSESTSSFTDTQSFIIYTEETKEIVIAFRGTTNPENVPPYIISSSWLYTLYYAYNNFQVLKDYITDIENLAYHDFQGEPNDAKVGLGWWNGWNDIKTEALEKLTDVVNVDNSIRSFLFYVSSLITYFCILYLRC